MTSGPDAGSYALGGDDAGGAGPGDRATPSRPSDGRRRVRVAHFGEPGAFAEDAMLAYFVDPEGVPCIGLRAVFEAVSAARLPTDPPTAAAIAAGIVPIENVSQGTVRETYDLLLEQELRITGEVVVPVRLCLAALPGQRLDEMERVYSHIQPLGQAEAYLRGRPWALLATHSTAGAARMIVERGERGAAALLSPRAAALFGLEILAADVQDVPDNRTRFLVLERAAEPAGGSDRPLGAIAYPPAPRRTHEDNGPMRTTLVLGVRNTPGALWRCLGVLARGGLNMSKLESRPLRGRPWEYVFWMELDADASVSPAREIVQELNVEAAWVRVLGSYPQAPEPRASAPG